MDTHLALASKPISSHTSRLLLASQYAGEAHLHRYEESSPHLTSTFSSPQAPLTKERHDSGSSAADHLDLASSPVNMQESTPPQQDGAATSLSEKKRNKLGYHRTSVACVHCRRRKIRCLVDQNDTQGRCQNCIRLKKECNFYPVDQQPPNERQRRSVAKGVSQTSASPAPSSQASGDAFAYPPPPMGYPAAMGSVHGGPIPIAPLDTANFNAPLRSNTWDPSYMESPMSAPGHMSDTGAPGFWGTPYSAGPDSARSAQFPNAFSPGRQDSWQAMHHAHQQVPVNAVGGQHGQQPRSLSLQHDSQGVYGGVPMGNSGFFDGRGPPSLQASTGSPATSVSLSDATTAPGQTQPSMHYGLPAQWDPNKEFTGPQGAMVPGWNPDPGMVPSMPDDGTQGWQQHPHGQGGFKQE